LEPSLPADAIARAAVMLTEADRPIILAGGGSLWSGAAPEIKALAQQIEAPVVTTLNAKGLIDERDSVSLGHARSAPAREVLPHADLMLAIGCRFTEVMTDWRRLPVPRNLIQIDLDPRQLGMNYPVALGIVGDARAAVRAIRKALPIRTAPHLWGKQ